MFCSLVQFWVSFPVAYFLLYEPFPVNASIWAKWLPIVEKESFLSFVTYWESNGAKGRVHVRGVVRARAVCEYEGGQPEGALIKAAGCE